MSTSKYNMESTTQDLIWNKQIYININSINNTMLSDIYRNQGLFKALFLTIGLVLIVFCFFFNVGEYKSLANTKSKAYYTFSARLHTSSSEGIDCYQDIKSCNGDGFCNTVKTTPYLGGFALGFIGLVLIFSFGESIISRIIKKYHIWIIQLVFLFLAWALILIIPILYLTTKGNDWSLCWIPIIFEFIAVATTSFSAFLYYKSNETKGPGLLS
ncbi:unnamed protein product (macronuclear) [Paramecium tetraurelia]|uniref:Transmembrane protein n=1 Tax=Paramecium tetraurelia TaxID=5888 RepID=A0BCA3_PARTE|nr:uncharacterized protein GSPATT00004264001 [Paramecium tetraurelia]CAK56170.1 unnamed protein product [Paramecium tetraurelia]|eukprot:XP_001423568.1 hypothetical protein (macronuclear) [Paramecium tetraurelia strain d4-2]